MAGRRPLPIDNPSSARARFAWLARTLRVYSPDINVRTTASFARILVPSIPAASINRLETGDLAFTFNRIQSYETALGLQIGDLLDVHLYLSRLAFLPSLNESSKSMKELNVSALDLLHRAAEGAGLNATEWYVLCSSIAGTSLMSSTKWRHTICSGILEVFGTSFEKDERILREAMIVLGEPIVPYIAEYARSTPISHFNSIEALGFIPVESAWDALCRFAVGDLDTVQTQTLLEPLRRWIRAEPYRVYDLLGRAPTIVGQCVDILADISEAFTAREEALALLQIGQLPVPEASSRRLHSIREDIAQLRLKTTQITHSELLLTIRQRQIAAYEASDLYIDRLPADTPGLSNILRDALFAPERTERLALATVLSYFDKGGHMSAAISDSLVDCLTFEDYGLQRVMIRLLTKIGHHGSHVTFTGLAAGTIEDEGVRLCVAWALGTATGKADDSALRRLYNAGTPVTRRVATLSAARRGFLELVAHACLDSDARVAAEAVSLRKMLISRRQVDQPPVDQ